MPEYALFPTKHRKAFLRAVNVRGRVIRYHASGEAWDNTAALQVTARLAEAFAAGWGRTGPRSGPVAGGAPEIHLHLLQADRSREAGHRMTTAEQPFSPLVGDILTAVVAQTAATTNQVMDNYQRQIADLEAELYAIRNGVSMLLAGPYMPTPDALRRAVFYPDQKLIDECRENREVGW